MISVDNLQALARYIGLTYCFNARFSFFSLFNVGLYLSSFWLAQESFPSSEIGRLQRVPINDLDQMLINGRVRRMSGSVGVN